MTCEGCWRCLLPAHSSSSSRGPPTKARAARGLAHEFEQRLKRYTRSSKTRPAMKAPRAPFEALSVRPEMPPRAATASRGAFTSWPADRSSSRRSYLDESRGCAALRGELPMPVFQSSHDIRRCRRELAAAAIAPHFQEDGRRRARIASRKSQRARPIRQPLLGSAAPPSRAHRR